MASHSDALATVIWRLNRASATPSNTNTNPIPSTLVDSSASSVIHPKKEMPTSEVAVAIAV